MKKTRREKALEVVRLLEARNRIMWAGIMEQCQTQTEVRRQHGWLYPKEKKRRS